MQPQTLELSKTIWWIKYWRVKFKYIVFVKRSTSEEGKKRYKIVKNENCCSTFIHLLLHVDMFLWSRPGSISPAINISLHNWCAMEEGFYSVHVKWYNQSPGSAWTSPRRLWVKHISLHKYLQPPCRIWGEDRLF